MAWRKACASSWLPKCWNGRGSTKGRCKRRSWLRLKIPVQRLAVAAVAEPHVVIDVDLVANHADGAVAQQAVESARMRAIGTHLRAHVKRFLSAAALRQ